MITRRTILGAAAGTTLAAPALAQRAKTLRLGSPQPAESNYHKAG